MVELIEKLGPLEDGSPEMKAVEAELATLGQENPDALRLMEVVMRLVAANVKVGGKGGIPLTPRAARVIEILRKRGWLHEDKAA